MRNMKTYARVPSHMVFGILIMHSPSCITHYWEDLTEVHALPITFNTVEPEGVRKGWEPVWERSGNIHRASREP